MGFFLVPAVAAIAAGFPLFSAGGYHGWLAVLDVIAVLVLLTGILVAAREQFAWIAQEITSSRTRNVR